MKMFFSLLSVATCCEFPRKPGNAQDILAKAQWRVVSLLSSVAAKAKVEGELPFHSSPHEKLVGSGENRIMLASKIEMREA